jgi:hypothetical protein
MRLTRAFFPALSTACLSALLLASPAAAKAQRRDFSHAKWSDLTAQRKLSQAYTNGAGHAIDVSVSTYSGKSNDRCDVSMIVDGIRVAYQFMNNNQGDAMCHVSAIIPPGSTYSANAAGTDISLYLWAELR